MELPADKIPAAIGKPLDFVRETDYRLASFLAWSKRLRGSKVALYGSGANARRILEADNLEFSIVAVIDDSAIGKTVCGKTIMGLDESLSLGIDTIVIAAATPSADSVFQRIGASCRQAKVHVFDMYGNEWDTIETALQSALDQTLASQLEEIEACRALCINIELFLYEQTRASVSKTIREQGRIEQILTHLVGYSLAQGKRVAYYSTTPSISLQTAAFHLERAGLADTGPLFLPACTDLHAENGLFRLMCSDVPANDIVHIGPNLLRDCLIPLCYGRKSILAGFLEAPNHIAPISPNSPSAQEEWYEADTLQDIEPADERLASCAREILPEIAESIGEQTARVVSITAPLVVGFVTWLADCIERSGEDYREVLFAARDGFIVKKAYDILRNTSGNDALPPSRYFYTSRKAGSAAIEFAAERAGALRYLSSCGLRIGKAYAFVEFVGAGTCQRQLEQFIPFGLKGFYFGSRVGSAITRKLAANTYFGDEHMDFLSRYLVLEPYMSSPEPSLRGFTDEGAPAFDDEYRTPDELQELKAVHDGVALFAQCYFGRWHKPGDIVSASFLNNIMPYLDLCNTDRMSLVDDWSGRALTKRLDAPFASDKEGNACDRANGNPGNIDATSRRLYRLLAAFDTVCGEFDLTYIATHGTLLGAVRDGGLVAGDDDIDVAMPRTDYDRLLALAESGIFPAPLRLVTPENDDTCFFGGYAKLIDASAAETDAADSAPWIDIMPLDNCPTSDGEIERHQRIIRILQRLLYAKTYPREPSRLWDIDPSKISGYFLAARSMDRQRLCRRLRKACMSCEPTGLLTIFAGNYLGRANNVRYRSDDVEHACRMRFGAMTVPMPANAELWLEEHYGKNWRIADKAYRPAHSICGKHIERRVIL